jgi:poly(3-hydroxybutyrate) depolymerase
VTINGTQLTLPSGRKYWLCGDTTSGDPRNLIVACHSTDHDAAWMDSVGWVVPNHPELSGWSTHAASHGYLLALADGVGHQWNVGYGWQGGTADDVGYLADIVTDVQARALVSRAHTAGVSAGGAMAWRAAADRPDVFAACAMGAGWAPYYPTTHAMDCRHDHGTADTTVPIRGGQGTQGMNFPPAYDAMVKCVRPSRVALYATDGGHSPGCPGWWADAVLRFFTVERFLP